MRRRVSFLFSLLAVILCAASARADVVHVVYQTSADGTVATVAETTLETGCNYVTVSAPSLDGFIFTYWSSSESDPLVVRDAWGRTLDAARFTLYQDVTLTAHYVAATLDSPRPARDRVRPRLRDERPWREDALHFGDGVRPGAVSQGRDEGRGRLDGRARLAHVHQRSRSRPPPSGRETRSQAGKLLTPPERNTVRSSSSVRHILMTFHRRRHAGRSFQ